MSVELDVEIDEKDEFMEENGDLSRLKSSVVKRKGRGFKESGDERLNEPFDSIKEDTALAGGPQRSVEGWILFVTNVHEEAQEDDLHNLFGDHGNIRNMHLNLDRRTGFLKGYALIEYETFKEAQNALDAINREELLGQELNVDWAFTTAKSKKKKTSKR